MYFACTEECETWLLLQNPGAMVPVGTAWGLQLFSNLRRQCMRQGRADLEGNGMFLQVTWEEGAAGVGGLALQWGIDV